MSLVVEYWLNGEHLIDWDEPIDPGDVEVALDGIYAAADNLVAFWPGDVLEMRVDEWVPAGGWVRHRRSIRARE